MRINKFRIKLFVLITISLVVPVVLCCVLLFSFTENTVKNYTAGKISDALKTNVRNIETKLTIMDDASVSLEIQLSKIPSIADSSSKSSAIDIFNDTKNTFNIQKSLVEGTNSIAGSKSFYLYFPYRELLLVSNQSYFEDVKPNSLDCHDVFDGKWGVSTPYEYELFNPVVGEYMREKYLSLNHQMLTSDGQYVIITTNIEEAYLNQLMISDLNYTPSFSIIIRQNGEVISSQNKYEIGVKTTTYNEILSKINEADSGKYFDVRIEDKDYIVNWEYSLDKNWHYIVITEADLITNSITELNKLMYIFMSILILVAIGITVLLIKAAVSPMKPLNFAMTEIKNKNYSVQLPINEGDEFSVFYSGFNDMAHEIEVLLKTNESEKNQKTEAYIQMLQTQINPHMLYNSLESIYSIAKVGKREDIASLVMALSKFYRIGLSCGKSMVPFRDAFELAKQFITISSIRLNNQVAFTHDVQDSVMDIQVPKFLLQPLVENALMYGYSNKCKEFSLHISAKQSEQMVRIVVHDNGMGIHENAIKELNERIVDFDFDDNNTNNGYALRNLNYQIKLNYGEESTIHLESVYGVHTEAIILLKVKETK